MKADFLKAAFGVALYTVNNDNVAKHRNDQYTPLVQVNFRCQQRKDGVYCCFDNNVIYAINHTVETLKTAEQTTIVLKRDFVSFDDAVDYFRRVIQHKIFRQHE